MFGEVDCINNYVPYHVHSDLSLLDSCTKYQDYVDRAVELNQRAIAITEHGKPLQWIAKKMYCDKKGIKYLHGVECYLTETHKEKTRDNYHTILIAKNYQGVLEINKLISLSCNDDHFYYVNRLSFDEFLKISNNVIKISACLGSPLNKIGLNHPYYEKLVKHYDYLEIQPHNCEDQIAYNRHLAALATKYKKPLIAGTDTHSLNSYKAECRKILMKAKRKSFGDEDLFDLTYKTYEELVDAFKKQDALPEKLFMSAIENTNKMADSVEDFELDTSIKYPILYGSQEDDVLKFRETIDRKFAEKIEKGIIPEYQIQGFKDAIEEEKRVFEKIGMAGFMLSMSELICWCHDNGIPTGPARGSVGGSRIAYITDIIDLNPETWKTVFSRFCNEDRVEIGDIDIDVIDTDRPKIFEYIIKRFGKEKTARVAAFGTIVDKGTVDEICRGLSYIWKADNPDSKDDDNPYSIDNAKKIKREYEVSPEKARKKFPDVFYYFDGLVNTKVSQSVHPAGMIISPITLADHYGVFDKDGDMCLMMDMEEAHEVGLAKYDFLILKNIAVINDTYKLIGKKYPKTHEINWNDKDVWDDMLRSPTAIFQFESDFAFTLLKRFKPRSIFDMSLVTACIRPSGSSYRNDLIDRKPYKNPSSLIDELLKDNNGYLIYQEDTIKFLQQICGLSGSEADNVRRAIGRKDEERLNAALPAILEGYCNKSNKPRAEAEKEAQAFLTIIKDSASYQFGYNHSIAYCLVGYICAYLRHYYPYEFITASLNNAANEDDVKNGTSLAQEYGIKISPPKYGASKDKYFFDKNKMVIAKGLESIKYLNKQCALDLYDISQRREEERFMDVLLDIKHTAINSRQLDILMKIDFFSDLGNLRELTMINKLFERFKQGDAKTIKKSALLNDMVMAEIVSRHSTDKNKNGIELKSYTVTDMQGLLYDVEDYIKGLNLPDVDFKTKRANQLECLGYIDIVTNKPEDLRKIFITDCTPLKDKKTGEPWCYRVGSKSMGSGKQARLSVIPKTFQATPFKAGDMLYADKLVKNHQGYWYMTEYHII